MGATKRLAELAVAEVARASGRRYVSVRFGNVLGSSGSVVPLFQRQLREGVPLTITDAEMTRFFMTIPEAARLILEASLFGESGDLFVLDMGDPVRIVDLARDLARLAGRDPDSVPIQFIGLRPGEKLHESLFYDAEAIESTRHPKVLRARDGGRSSRTGDVLDALDELVAVGAMGDHEGSRRMLASTLARLDPAPAVEAVGS
jgi:FlaA1/EpsC-like NDP-sugar epimerase